MTSDVGSGDYNNNHDNDNDNDDNNSNEDNTVNKAPSPELIAGLRSYSIFIPER